MLYRSSVDYFSLFLHQFNIYEKKRKSDEQLAYSQGIKTQHYINVSEKKMKFKKNPGFSSAIFI